MTVGNTLLSGVNLEGGKLGYDTKKITSSKTWTSAGINIAAGTITGGIKMSGMSTSLVNGVAGGLSGGITTGDWKGSMVDSMRNSAAGYLGGNLGGGNDALTNASSMLFRKMMGSKEDFSWDTVAQNDAIGKLVGGYLNEMLMSDEQKNARAADEQKRQQEQARNVQGFNLMNMVENTIGGFFTNIGKDLKALASDVGNAASGVKSAWGSIQSGEAWENIKTGAASAWEGIKGAASWVKDTAVSAWNGIKDTAVSAWNSVAGAVSSAVGAVGTFTQKTGNWFAGDGFNSDDQVEEIRAKERIQEAIKNGIALEEGSAEYKRMEAALNKKFNVGADADSQARIDEKLESYKQNKDVGERLADLSKLASQKGDGYALQEIEKALKNIPGGDKLNAKEILSKSCNALTMWITLKEAGANVGEFGEFFEKQVKAENIRAKDAYTGSPYKISSHYAIDGKKVDVGFIDGKSNPVEGFNQYEKLLKSGQVSHGEVFFQTSHSKYHALSVYSSQGEMKIADVSYRPNGSEASTYVRNTNFKWFFYIKNGRR